MGALLSSPRKRRRTARVGVALLAVGAGVLTAWIAHDGGREFEPDVRSSGPAEVVEQEQPVAFTPKIRDDVIPVASRFVSTAVERKNVGASWPLVHPDLRRGFTRQQWSRGDIPVVPYPVGGARWDVQYSFEGTVGLYVLLMPKQGSDVPPTTFLLELKRNGERWLVSSWVPSAGAAEAAAGRSAESLPSLPLAEPGAFDQGNLSPLFLIVPVAGTLGLALVLLAFFLTRSWLRSRRALRAYGSRGRLPDLPRPPPS